jgi:hypothetical protein
MYLKARREIKVQFEAMVYAGLLKMFLAKAGLCRAKQRHLNFSTSFCL